jgi:hypothetical protein
MGSCLIVGSFQLAVHYIVAFCQLQTEGVLPGTLIDTRRLYQKINYWLLIGQIPVTCKQASHICDRVEKHKSADARVISIMTYCTIGV